MSLDKNVLKGKVDQIKESIVDLQSFCRSHGIPYPATILQINTALANDWYTAYMGYASQGTVSGISSSPTPTEIARKAVFVPPMANLFTNYSADVNANIQQYANLYASYWTATLFGAYPPITVDAMAIFIAALIAGGDMVNVLDSFTRKVYVMISGIPVYIV